MNEPTPPTESEFEISVPEGVPPPPEEAVPGTPAQDIPVPEVPGSATYVLPEPEAAPAEEPPTEQPPTEEPPPEEPPIVRHDPFAYMRGAPWMNRALSPSGRAAALARRELKAFPVIESRDPNHADLDAIVKRTVDYMVPIFKRERATDAAYDELEKRRAARIAAKQKRVPDAPTGTDPNIVRVGGLQSNAGDTQVAQAPALPSTVQRPPAETIAQPQEGVPVVLPNGKTVPSEYSRTGVLMSPFADLRDVAAAGRKAFWDVAGHALTNPFSIEDARKYGRELVRRELGQGGRFDYQRLWIPDQTTADYLQLPQFRDVANFNVGLFMQQIGVFNRKEVLKIAGDYAKEHSSNYRPDQDYGLDPRTRVWIERGYDAGESGMFTDAPADGLSAP